MMACIDLREFTHFARSPSHNGWVAFAYEDSPCPVCGARIYNSAASSPNLMTTREILMSYGLTHANTLPPDLVMEFADVGGEDREYCESCMGETR